MNDSTDKFALIYEFNNDSPLFARVADKLVKNNQYDKAQSILEKGISNFPNYPTAYLIYGIVLASVGKKSEGEAMIRKAGDILDDEETMNYYLSKIEKIESSHLPPSDALEPLPVLENEAEKEESTEQNIEAGEESSVLSEDNEDENLGPLAERLSNASIPEIQEETGEELPDLTSTDDDYFPGKSLVSETLAKIYFNQGNFREALSIYETLIEIQPSKQKYYQDLIDHIKTRMEN